MSSVAFDDPADWEKAVLQTSNGDWFGKAQKKGVEIVPGAEFPLRSHPYFVFTRHFKTEKLAAEELIRRIAEHNPSFA